MKESIQGNITDVNARHTFYGTVTIEDGKIHSIEKQSGEDKNAPYMLPGFIDAHVHIESSMLVPSEFARIAVTHGTIATISDPHEIANVCGLQGVQYMIDNGKTVPFKFHFGAPSCVPATTFETAGAVLNADIVGQLLASDDIFYLSEMMNFPGVLQRDDDVLKKINAAQKCKKPVDGHAPGLLGGDAIKYINAGISTDHECFTKDEALHKLKHGMKILIREGSAAKNFDALIDLLHDYEDEIMFCSDDKHPDSLVQGHINELCRRAVQKGIDIYKVLKAACINPALHYKTKTGRLRPGDAADFIICEDLQSFNVKATYINGLCVAKNGKSLINPAKASIINHFNCGMKQPSDFELKGCGKKIRVIVAEDGQLITGEAIEETNVSDGLLISDTAKDILKIAVVNRYQKNAPVSIAFVRNFGLKHGAIASSVAHDSHNIIAVGVDDQSLAAAVNLIIARKGGISIADSNDESNNRMLALPVAGLMSNEDGYEVAKEYTAMDKAAKNLGSRLTAPFMTLSFMALLVIPKLKISDKGLFNGSKFTFVPVNHT